MIGLGLHLARNRVPEADHPWLLGAGPCIVSILVLTGGSRTVAVSFSFFFIWVVMYCLLFFSPLGATVQIGFAAVAYFGCLASLQATAGRSFSAVEPICLVAVVSTMSLVVMRLARALEGVTCSLGGAPWQPGDSASLLLGRADAALYQAKREGRDRVAWNAADFLSVLLPLG